VTGRRARRPGTHGPLPPPAAVRATARTIALAPADAQDLASAAAALPDPDELPPGTLVLLPAELREEPSIARSVLAVFGRTRTATRVLRCSALVARGYMDVGAGTDPVTRADLVWGYAGGRA
jgi:hypothetical protein